MTAPLRLLLIGILLAAPASAPAQSRTPLSPTAEQLFADASAKELAVRKALNAKAPPTTVLKAVRTVVLDYEAIVRRYPADRRGGEALWRAAVLSSDAFRSFGDEREQAAAVRLLDMLSSQYPSSSFARQGPALIAELSVLPVRTPLPAAPAPPSSSSASATAATRTPTAVERQVPAAEPPAVQARVAAPPRTAPGGLATITDIRRVALPEVVRIIIELDREVSFHDERIENPTRVFLDLPSTEAVKTLRDQTIRFDGDTDLVRQVRLGRHPNSTTRVVLEAADVTSYSVYPLYNPFRLVIDCLRQQSDEPLAALPPFPQPATRPAVARTAAALPPSKPPVLLALPARRVDAWTLLPGIAPTATAAIREAVIVAADPPAPLPVTPTLEIGRPVTPVPVPSTRLPPAAAAAPVAPPSSNLAGGFSLARQLGMGVSRIVIDAGHGGHDPGAKGGGTTEAELVLDIALRLEKLLINSPGVEVVLTRRTDEFITLQERTAIANREGADLFLSIHANASRTSAAGGVETYFLNFATTLSAAAVAARENAASGHSMGELPDVVRTIALNNKLDESKDFATYVQRELVTKLRTSNRTLKDLGVKQAPFQVLIGAAMPSVLAEVSFMTNVQEGRLLKQAAYRQKIAEALFSAVRKYQGSLTRVSTIAQQP